MSLHIKDEVLVNAHGADRALHVVLAIEGMHDRSGGAERVVADVSRMLHDRGHRVTVLTYEERNGPSFHPLKFGVERVDARPRHSRRKKRPPLSWAEPAGRRLWPVAIGVWLGQHLPRILRLRRALRRIRPDVVVGFMPSMFPYLTLAAIGLPVKTVASVHNVPRREFGADPRRWSQNLLDKRIRLLSLRLADATTVLLPSFRGQFSRASVRRKTHVIPNVIRPCPGPLADVGEDPSGPNTILAVGRLAHAKDHQSLIEAWALLEARFPGWQLRIIGSGPLEGSLQRRIRLSGVTRLKILPPTRDIQAHYSAARFLVMPSRYEGFGLVTGEALASGLPVIGFASCEGTNELVEHERNGLLVNPRGGRARALARAMERMITDAKLRTDLARRAPPSVARFAPAIIADQWETLLTGLVAPR